MTLTYAQRWPNGAITSKLRTIAVAAMVGFAAAFSLGVNAQAATEINVQEGYAVHGYDVVAYFTVGQPTPGSDQFTAVHDNVTYRFSSSKNRDTFTADPAAYAPQYGGYCAFGTSVGRKFDGDPHAWRIIDGKLYLNLNKKVQATWLKDVPGYIRGADNNWPIIVSLTDAVLETNPPAGLTQGAI